LDKKIKIAIVVYTLKSGGLERVVANQTILFDSLGFDVELFVVEHGIDYPFKGKLHVFNLGESQNIFSKIKKYFKIKKLIRNGNFDYVLDHRYRLNNLMETIWLKFIYKKQQLIYFIHSADLPSYINKKVASQSVIRFISVSKGIQNKVLQMYPKVNIETIYNNVDVSRKEFYFPEIKDNYILAVGRMDASNVKQFDVLIDCYSKSILSEKNIKLLILGSGTRKKNLEQQVSDLNLQDKVIFKGFETELYSFYKNAKYLVLCSKYEGLGMVLIESLLSGSPVISYNCDFGPNEIVQNQVNGLLVENQSQEKLINAMNLFVENESLYFNCKKNASHSVLKFSSKNIADQWMRFFNDKP